MMCERTISYWLSKVILRTCSDECKLIYRTFEKSKIRITNERFHLQFNLACINKNINVNITRTNKKPKLHKARIKNLSLNYLLPRVTCHYYQHCHYYERRLAIQGWVRVIDYISVRKPQPSKPT